MIIGRIAGLVIGYICGMFSTGYIYGKTKHVDIRTMGSGSTGATNAQRTLGVKAGLITFLGDVFKTAFAIFLTWLLFHAKYPDYIRMLELYAGLGAIIGHNYPAPMKFKGGKGIACTAGILLAFCPFEIPVCFVLFVGTVALTRYVSVGSILVVTSFFIQTVIFGQLGFFHTPDDGLLEIYILSAIVMVMGIVRHRSNIGRLMKGTENKFSFNFDKKA